MFETPCPMARRTLAGSNPRRLSRENTAGDVACALQTAAGNVYLGVSIDVGSDMGFCAEHAAIAARITAGETPIGHIVAVWGDDTVLVLPLCGRCHEFMFVVYDANLEVTDVILGENSSVKLKELLPYPYTEVWGPNT